jgi:hypothetical protein
MVDKKTLKFWARQVEIVHIIGFLLAIISIFLLFLSYGVIRIVAAFYILLIFSVQKIYGLCPLTKIENIFIELTGEGISNKKFVPRFFKKYFHFTVSDRIVNFIMWLASIFSVWILINFFFL